MKSDFLNQSRTAVSDGCIHAVSLTLLIVHTVVHHLLKEIGEDRGVKSQNGYMRLVKIGV